MPLPLKSDDVEKEMVRLNTKLLQTVPGLKHHDNHVTIALLNVRSIVAKLPDIAEDNSLNLLTYSVSVKHG